MPPRVKPRSSSLAIFLAFLGVVAAIAGIEGYALYSHQRTRTAAIVPAPSSGAVPLRPALIAGPIGSIDAPLAEGVVGPRVTISGWALDPLGVHSVEIRIDDQKFAAKLKIARPDVAQVKTGFPDNPASGFEFTGEFPPRGGQSADRREIAVVAIALDGRETVLGRKSLIDPAALTRWSAVAGKRDVAFYLLPALSGIDIGDAAELDTMYAPYLSATTRVGFRVPILYLRTTKGAANDYAFDPNWDSRRRCGDRRISDDSLATVLAHSRAKQLPVLVTLNGGIWADAYCDVPQWDVNDRLEQNPGNCQWNQNNEVMADAYLKDLPGSQDAPLLARSLTFNVYASEVRRYKKRNLQQAGRVLARFARAHPHLFVGVNLDPDTYLNPFFAERQWYDYNPGTLRQFREWLSGTGPYAGKPNADVPDLTAYRRVTPLTLTDVNRLAQRKFIRWNDVDPPRAFPRSEKERFWEDPWVREWETFRRHLVDLHYDELAQWLVAAGLSRDRIWSSQGLMAPAGDAMPFALTVESPVKNFDSGGMSVAGAKPALGHLGAILYGASAVNAVQMENGASLLYSLAAIDPRFAVVEFNTADLRHPHVQPDYAAGYRGLRDLWNFGARHVSPMAWNGSNGVNAGKPGYSTFTAWRNTPLEEAARDFLLARAGLPLGSLLYSFGTPRHADDDGWTAETGTIALNNGGLTVTPDSARRVTLLSPPGLPPHAGRAESFVIGLRAGLTRVRVSGRQSPEAGWTVLADAGGAALRATPAGIVASRSASAPNAEIDQFRLDLEFADATPRMLTRFAAIQPGS